MYSRPELLIPANNLEVLKIAVMYGADAVYIGGEAFGLRANAKNFTSEDMKEGIEFAHEHGVKVFVTANILAHNSDLNGVRRYMEELKEIKPDALIIADPAIFTIAKEVCPEIEIHISTQANNTNYGTVSSSSLSIPYGTTYTISGNKLTFSNGTTVTATTTAATGYTTTVGSWSSTSGTITGNTTITVNFSRRGNNYNVIYNCNGGTPTDTYTSAHVYGTASNLKANQCKKTGAPRRLPSESLCFVFGLKQGA